MSGLRGWRRRSREHVYNARTICYRLPCSPIMSPGSIMPPPIICCIIAGIPCGTKPVTSRACARMASVRAGSPAVSSAITPVAVKVN